MVLKQRRCSGTNAQGQPCGYGALRGKDLCFWHDPAHAEEAREARRLGGQRRRREGVLQGSYDFDGLETVSDLRRLLEIATTDALALENSVARIRVLVSVVQVGAKLLETGELEERITRLERTVASRQEEGLGLR